MTSLLVTNDFPPKIGGIQSYLHELWRRLPAADTTVFTTRHAGDLDWDATQPFRVVRSRSPVFLPTPSLAADIDALARDVGAEVVFVDPWLPLGALAPRLRAAPYVVVVHGAEVTVPARVPGARAPGRRALRAAAGIVAAGEYPARMAVRAAGVPLPGVVVPPGVDVERFVPLGGDARAEARAGFGLDPDVPLVVGISRLVPRKGFDVLIDAVAGLLGVHLAIGGAGRDRRRLVARADARGVADRVHFLGRVPEADLPTLYACADVFAMPCRDRWGGLEAEGFGIVFLEAAAAGVPVVAGTSGGSSDAVDDGITGSVVDGRSASEVQRALATWLDDPQARASAGVAARSRAVAEFSYERLVERLAPVARGELDALGNLAMTVDAGHGVIVFGWAANALFLVTAVPAAAGVDAVEGVAVAVSLGLFFVSLGAFAYAFVLAAARSAQGDNVAVANLFFLQGSAPKPVQLQFLAMFGVCTLIACATVVWAPFGVLVPMLPVGLAGVWAAREGTFPPRLPPTRR